MIRRINTFFMQKKSKNLAFSESKKIQRINKKKFHKFKLELYC